MVIVVRVLVLDVVVDDDLVEIDFGVWEGLMFVEVVECDFELYCCWL